MTIARETEAIPRLRTTRPSRGTEGRRVPSWNSTWYAIGPCALVPVIRAAQGGAARLALGSDYKVDR